MAAARSFEPIIPIFMPPSYPSLVGEILSSGSAAALFLGFGRAGLVQMPPEE